MSSPYVAIRTAARRLNVHENTVRNWIDRGIFHVVRLPTGVRKLPLSELERIEREIMTPPTSFYEQKPAPAPKSLHDTAQERIQSKITF